MKHLIIIFSFLSSFYSIFAQGDSAATRRKTAVENRARVRSDSFNARAKTIWIKSDSFRIKADSFRLNGQRFKTYEYNSVYNSAYNLTDNLINIYNSDTLSKEITMEVNCNADATIFVENIYRKLIVKTSTDNKVKITTTVNYSADSKLTDADWFEKLNLELKSNNNQVVLKSNNINNSINGLTTISLTGQGVASNSATLQHYDFYNVSKDSNANSVAVSRGYRVMVLSTNDKELAYKTKEDLVSTYPDSRVYMSYQAPFYKIKTGDFLKKDDAESFKKELAKKFTGNLIIVNDAVQLKPDEEKKVLSGVNVNWANKRINTQKVLTIYIPAGAKLDVESKYADVEIQNDLKTIKADITNASLRFMNVENVDIQGKYAKVNAGNIKKADIELNNGKFYGKNIYSAKFDSKYSNIEFGVINDLKIESNNDQYEIDEVTDLTAHKNYGNIRITNLKNSFSLTGNNADIKIRDIAAGVSNIKIDDKYADIRLPVNNLANYTVDFDGKNCNVYAPFEKVPVIKIEELKPKEQPKQMEGETKIKALKATQPLTLSLSSLGPLTMTRVGYLTDLKDNAFKASVGDTKGKHAELQLICTNCTVDFK